jgi:hypothetical protein
MQTWKRFEYRIRDYFQKKGFTSERIPVSGVSSIIKGDVVAQKEDLKFRIDAKSTLGKKEIRIRRESLEKIKEEVKEGEIPVVVFSFYRHHTLYGVVERSLVPKWNRGVVEKSTWARDSIGLKRKEVVDTTKDGSALLFSFEDSNTEFMIAKLDDLIESLSC